MTKPDLVRIEGAGGNILEIELTESADFFVTTRTHDVSLGDFSTRAQFPNPWNGGGDLETYKQIKSIYDLFKK